jgi:hypothetical protein
LEKLPESSKNLEEIWKIIFIHDQVIFCTFQEIFVFSSSQELVSIINGRTDFESFHFTNNKFYANQKEDGLQVFENGKLLAG